MKKLYLILFLFVAISFSSCKVGRFFIYNFADINDHKKFPKRAIEKPNVPFQFHYNLKEPIVKKITLNKKGKETTYTFDEYLALNETVAFLVIRKDTIIYEKYFDGYNQESIVPSFSMAKSVIATLIGCAIDDGYIQSVNEPITNYLPELKKNGLDNVSINDLLNMKSGIAFNESYYNPFGHAASFYYGRNLRKDVSKLTLNKNHQKTYSYSSGDSQILGLVLEASLKNKNISKYLQEKIWHPLGMQSDASWSLDKKNGVEKTFCCLNAVALDYAKLGRLYLHNGNWNDKQIISKNWVEKTTLEENNESGVGFYQNHWWIANQKTRSFYAQGILGQYIYVDPKSEIIIVRLGRKSGKYANWVSVFEQLAK